MRRVTLRKLWLEQPAGWWPLRWGTGAEGDSEASVSARQPPGEDGKMMVRTRGSGGCGGLRGSLALRWALLPKGLDRM